MKKEERIVLLGVFLIFIASLVNAGTTVTKTANETTINAGDYVNYTINVTHDDIFTFDFLNLTDMLVDENGQKFEYVSSNETPLQLPDRILWNRTNFGPVSNLSLWVVLRVMKGGEVNNTVMLEGNDTLGAMHYHNGSAVVSSVGDAYEYDDEESKWIETDGTLQYHSFDWEGDEDWVKFNATGGEKYYIRTQNITSAMYTDTKVYLYENDRSTLLEYNDDIGNGKYSSEIMFKPLVNGIYHLKLTEFSGEMGGNYSIYVQELGNIETVVVEPAGDRNVMFNSTFDVTIAARCVGGPCPNVTAALDPKESKGMKDMLDEFLEQEEPKLNIKKKKHIANHKGTKTMALTMVSPGKITRKYLKQLKQNPEIEYFEPIVSMHAFLDVSGPRILADEVHKIQVSGVNVTGKGQTVCVIDSGLDWGHADFGGNNTFPNQKVIGGYDFINNDTFPEDEEGDCYAHGTHVAGIIASEDPTYTGIAPGARIVAIKALTDVGSTCSGDSDIIADAVQWCVDNASKYNITVISLSLGSGGHQDFCDSEYPRFAEVTDNAVAAGISVVIASGNNAFGYNGDQPSISSPACIKNAIPVGRTNKVDDGIAISGNRAWILNIMAPGTNIIATDAGATHTSKSGTSMSTPHVSGTIALMQQYAQLKWNRSLSVEDVNSRLRETGLKITDTGSTELDFTRIDAYEASIAKGLVPMTAGARPFYTTDQNPVSCGDLSDGEWCNTTWTVHATGEVNTTWKFFGIYTIDGYEPINTTKWNMTISSNPPNVTDVSVNPNPAYTNDTLNCSGNYSDMEMQPESGSIKKWYVNDTFVYQGNMLTGIFFNKTDNVTCEYIPSDGVQFGEGVNASIVISNLGPSMQGVNVTPIDAKVNDTLNATVYGSDPDNDVLIYHYQWQRFESGWVNISGETGQTLDAALVGEGNATRVMVWPSDGELNGSGVYSAPVNISIDTDDDGYNHSVDCNDTDFFVNPGVLEIFYDSVDNDCNASTIDYINYSASGDDDSDGVSDESDTLHYNSSNITGPEVEVYIDGNPNLSIVDSSYGIGVLTMMKNSTVIVNVTINFSKDYVNLANVTIEHNTSGVSVNGLGFNKSIRMNHTLTSGYVCVLDKEGVNTSSVSTSCSGTNHYSVKCDGLVHNGYVCVDEGDTYFVSGVMNSAIIEYTPTAAPSHSGGGGGGGGSSQGTTVYEAGDLTQTSASFELRRGESVQFEHTGGTYLMKLLNIYSGYISVTVNGVTDKVYLGVLSAYDLDLDGENDIDLLLYGTGSKANIKITSLYRPRLNIPLLPPAPRKAEQEKEQLLEAEETVAEDSEMKAQEPAQVIEENLPEVPVVREEPRNYDWAWLGAVLVTILLAGVYFVHRKPRPKVQENQ